MPSEATARSDRRMIHEESRNVQEKGGDNGLISPGTRIWNFPEDVLENIISRVPFPYLFKGRVLSKTWYSKFPSQLTKSLWPCLQNSVSSISSEKPIYSPVYVNDDAIVGFDRTSARWLTMMDISQLPISNWSSETCGVTCAGSLVCATVFDKHDGTVNAFVTNAITRGWRKLVFQTGGGEGEPVVAKIILRGSQVYEVLMVFRSDSELQSHVYDSSRMTYRRDDSAGLHLSGIYPASAYLAGNLYCMFDSGMEQDVSLWIYNVANNAWSTIPDTPLGIFEGSISECGVLLCGNKIMVVICRNISYANVDVFEGGEYGDEEKQARAGQGLYIYEGSIFIHELDVNTLKLQRVTSGPPQVTYGVGLVNGRISLTSDSEFIYFGQTIPGIAVLRYNIQHAKWDCLPPAYYDLNSMGEKWMTDPFQPGLCPFMIV